MVVSWWFVCVVGGLADRTWCEGECGKGATPGAVVLVVRLFWDNTYVHDRLNLFSPPVIVLVAISTR